MDRGRKLVRLFQRKKKAEFTKLSVTDGFQEDSNCLMISIVLFMPRPSENMLIRVNNDGTYCANWTPGAVGLYTIHVTIDGIEIGT